MRAKKRLPRKRYSPEFKMELFRLDLEQEGSITQQFTVPNEDGGFNQILKELKQNETQLILMEATGGLESGVAGYIEAEMSAYISKTQC